MKYKLSIAAEFLIFILIVVNAACCIPLTPDYDGLGFDGRFYAALRTPDSFPYVFSHHAPWCWRVLTPLLTSFLPYNTLDAFSILSLVSAFLCLVTLRSILIELNVSLKSRLIVTCLYSSVFWNVSWTIFSPAYIDSTAHLFTLLLIYLALKRFWLALVPAIALATLQKESALLISPTLAAIYFSFTKDRKKSLLYLALLLAIAGIAHGIMRYCIPAVNQFAPEAVFKFFLTEKLSNSLFWMALPVTVISALGVSWVPLLASPNTGRQIVLQTPWIFLFFATSACQVFLGADSPRILAEASVALVLLSGLILDQIKPPRHLIWPLVLLSFWVGALAPIKRHPEELIGYYICDNSLIVSSISFRLALIYALTAAVLAVIISLLLNRSASPHMQHVVEKLV